MNNGQHRQVANKLQKNELMVDRFTVPYAVIGDSGVPLIAVNGAQQTMASWFSLRKYLAGNRHLRLVLLDFPGQGRARINDGPPEVSFEEQLSVLGAVSDEVAGEQEIFLVGGSWGGVLAAAHAARFPERVAKLILGSFGTTPNKQLMEIIRKGQKLFDEERLDEVASLLIDGFGAGLPPAMRKKMRQQFASIPLHQFQHLYSQTVLFQHCNDIEKYVDLRAITAETLIINGAKDPILDNRYTEIAASRIPRCLVQLLPNVGHFLHLEQPEVLDVYSAFLSGQPT